MIYTESTKEIICTLICFQSTYLASCFVGMAAIKSTRNWPIDRPPSFLIYASRDWILLIIWKPHCSIENSEGIWLSGKTLDCLPRDCEFDPPSLQLKLLKKGDMYCMVLPRKNAPVYQCFTLGTLKNLVCHVWWALQYLALWATNRN